MKQKIQVFDYNFNDEDLENDFNDYMASDDMIALFTEEHLIPTISVSYIEAKSIVNEHGAYRKIFDDFKDYLNNQIDNKAYNEAILRVIYNPKSIQALTNNMKKVMRFKKTEVLPEHEFNFWNIVYYNKNLKL